MEIDLSVYTYGHYISMFYILNGIALIMNSPFADSLIKAMITVTMAYHGFRMAYAGAEGRSKEHLVKILSMSVIVGALLIPRGDIDVEDRITGQKDSVSNLPVAFILPVGIFESFGGGITSGFDQAFAPVGSLPFKDYGMLFGARLVNESRNWRIANPEFAGNMDAFLRRCVVLESGMGTRFTLQDLIETDDILNLVKTKAGTFRKVDLREGKRRHRMNCREAADYLETYLAGELDFLSKRYLNTDFAQAGTKHLGLGGMGHHSVLNRQLKSNIELAYGSTLGTNISAEKIIQQNMMINAIHDYNNKADLYGYTRASMQQESSWMIGGKLASEYLPIVLTVLKGLIYASFIFVVPFMIISGGMARYLNYLIAVISLQLWAPLNAILNLFIELYSGVIGSSITGGVLTYATFNESHAAIDKIVTVASGLQWAIPLLAYSIARGGSHAFINLASNIGSTSQGAASMAASDVTTGSRSLDNISIGNMQRAQQFAHKTDYNSSYASGANSYQHMDGTMEKVTGSGQTVLTSGAGQTVSSGSARFGIDQSKINQMNEGFNRSKSLVESDQLSYNSAKTSTLAKTSNLVSNLAQREAAGHTHNYESMGEQGKALQQAVNHAKELHDHNEYGWSQAAQASVTAYVDGGISSPVPGVKFDVGVRTEGSVEASNTSSQSLSEEERISRSNDASKNFNNMVRAASNENWMKENSVDTSYAQDIRGSHEEMQSFARNLSMHQEQAAAYSKAANVLDSMGSSSNHEMYHVVEERLMQDHNVSQQDAHRMIEKQDPKAARAWNNIVNEKINSIAGPISTFKDSVSGQAADAKMQLFENTHANKVNEGTMQYVDQAAFEQGLDRNKMQQNITNKGDELQQTGKQIQQENNNQRKSIEWHNKTLEHGMQKRADKYEEDRIGQGVSSKVVGALAQVPTVGHGGDINVGGPNKERSFQENYQGDQQRASNVNSKKK